jgi:lysophospholipase L1-like esterase
VLIIGDSISEGVIHEETNAQGYFLYAQQYLKGEAILTHNEGNAAYSAHTLQNIDHFLNTTPRPDLITWNNGLHDISDQDLGHRRAEIPEYQNNLRAIGKKLLASGARVIFFTTTNVPPHEKHRREADVVVYNAAARVVMRELGIPVYDLGGLSETFPPQYHAGWEKQDNVHYHRKGSKRLAHFVAQAIRTELKAAGKGQCVGWPGVKEMYDQMR